VGNKTFSRLFDTGAVVTFMGKQSLEMAFHQNRPRKISEASGDKMSSLRVFEMDLWIKGKKITHPNFYHQHKLFRYEFDRLSGSVIFICVRLGGPAE
jgi:hypothetical protein